MGKVVKINITLPEEELREVDAFIQMQGDTRSGFIRRAMQFFYIEQKGKEKKEKEKREGMAGTALEIKDEIADICFFVTFYFSHHCFYLS
jgi:metal-responsive CopG/Arc/MetJ family transcriptional regulator